MASQGGAASTSTQGGAASTSTYGKPLPNEIRVDCYGDRNKIGAIVRDSDGQIISGSGEQLTSHSVAYGQLMAVRKGLLLAKAYTGLDEGKHVTRVMVYSPNTVVVSSLNEENGAPFGGEEIQRMWEATLEEVREWCTMHEFQKSEDPSYRAAAWLARKKVEVDNKSNNIIHPDLQKIITEDASSSTHWPLSRMPTR